MELSNKTAREIYYEVLANPTRAKFGFGSKAAIVNIDLQKAYTAVNEFKTAYETNPNQIQYINEINNLARSKKLPVVFTYVAYMESAEDAGILGLVFFKDVGLYRAAHRLQGSGFQGGIYIRR